MQREFEWDVPPPGIISMETLGANILEMNKSVSTWRSGEAKPVDIQDGEKWHKVDADGNTVGFYVWRISDGDGDGTALLLEIGGTYASVTAEAGKTPLAILDPETGKIVFDDSWQMGGGAGLPLGAEYIWNGTEVPEGAVFEDGSTFSKTVFPEMYQALVDGKFRTVAMADYPASGDFGLWGLDTTSQTFRVPRRTTFAMGGASAETVGDSGGDVVTEGHTLRITEIPAHRHLTVNDQHVAQQTNVNASNSLAYEVYGSWFVGMGPNEPYAGRTSVTGGSQAHSHNQNLPPHIKGRWVVVVYSEAVPASTAQAQELITALQSKANVDLSNITNEAWDIVAKSDLSNLTSEALSNANIAPKPQIDNGLGQFGPVYTSGGASYTLPSGGTWAYSVYNYRNDIGITQSYAKIGVASGGSSLDTYSGYSGLTGWVWRIA